MLDIIYLRILLILTLSLFCPLFSENPTVPEINHTLNRVVYLMQAGHMDTALSLYNDYYNQVGHHDHEVIQKIGLILLDQGFRSDDADTQLLTLYGAGISANENALYILEEGIQSSSPQLQLVAMNFLARFQDDRADQILSKIMTSDYLILRLEGVYFLAERGVSTALAQTESLMRKVPEKAWSVFPQIFAAIGTPDAIRMLRKMMNHSNEEVRIAAILSAAEHHRDDMLPTIRKLATQHTLLQQEACAQALGVMKDETSISKLQKLTQVSSMSVRLAALQALYKLGKLDVRFAIENMAKNNYLFAIDVLGDMPGSESILYALTKSDDLQVRVNATAALLKRQDPHSLKSLREILFRDFRDLSFQQISSPGLTLKTYKVIPSSHLNIQDDGVTEEVSLHLREEILATARHLPEKDFLNLANDIFEAQQNDLVPVLIGLLVQLDTPGAVELVKKQHQKIGAPLVRNYCTLALYLMKEPGPYKNQLKDWVIKQKHEDLIRFRPLLPMDLAESGGGAFRLTPKETSRLLIDTIEALVDDQNDVGINLLLHTIQHGNVKNKYALAGLLLRAA